MTVTGKRPYSRGIDAGANLLGAIPQGRSDRQSDCKELVDGQFDDASDAEPELSSENEQEPRSEDSTPAFPQKNPEIIASTPNPFIMYHQLQQQLAFNSKAQPALYTNQYELPAAEALLRLTNQVYTPPVQVLPVSTHIMPLRTTMEMKQSQVCRPMVPAPPAIPAVSAPIPRGILPPHLIQYSRHRSVQRAYNQGMKTAAGALSHQLGPAAMPRQPPPLGEFQNHQEAAGAGNDGSFRRLASSSSRAPAPVVIPPSPALPVGTKNADVEVPYVYEDNEKRFGVEDENLSCSDVLCGRGGFTNNHMGNAFWRALVAHYRPKYGLARKNEKGDIAYSIVFAIRKTRGRFLKRDDDEGLWFEIGDERAKEKTGQQLREGLAKFRRETYYASKQEGEDKHLESCDFVEPAHKKQRKP